MCFSVYFSAVRLAVELQLKLNRMAQTTLRVTEADGDSDRMIVAPMAKKIIELERFGLDLYLARAGNRLPRVDQRGASILAR